MHLYGVWQLVEISQKTKLESGIINEWMYAFSHIFVEQPLRVIVGGLTGHVDKHPLSLASQFLILLKRPHILGHWDQVLLPYQGSHSSPFCLLPPAQELDPSGSPSLPANLVSFISNTCIYSVVIYWAHNDAWSWNRHFRKKGIQQRVLVLREKTEIGKKKFLWHDYSTVQCLISHQKREVFFFFSRKRSFEES